MNFVSVSVDEQFEDIRSDHSAYKLVVKNAGDRAIRLLRIEPRIPERVRVVEIIDTSIAETTSRRSDLLKELNQLLRRFLLVESKSFRDVWEERQMQSLKKAISFNGILEIYFELFFKTSSAIRAQIRRANESFNYRVSSASDASEAYTRWMKSASNPDHQIVSSLFQAKSDQLAKIEHLMDENERRSLTIIEANGAFAATYVVKFSRGILEPKKYQIAFDVVYENSDLGNPQTASAVVGAQISPYPLSLSIFAIVAALLGVVLQVSLSGATNILSAMLSLTYSGRILVAPIVALVFFNVYEYTSIGKSLTKMSVSWRSALLIGVLCGLIQDRILAALKAFITLSSN